VISIVMVVGRWLLVDGCWLIGVENINWSGTMASSELLSTTLIEKISVRVLGRTNRRNAVDRRIVAEVVEEGYTGAG
jgi:hypothetical protein